MINLAWDHNSYYHPRLLRALPAQCERALDVGCGKGEFAIRLAERAGRVDAVDRSAAMIEAARRVVPANVSCLQGDVGEMTLPAGAYDAITCISALHHLSLPIVLPRLAQALRWVVSCSRRGRPVGSRMPPRPRSRRMRRCRSPGSS